MFGYKDSEIEKFRPPRKPDMNVSEMERGLFNGDLTPDDLFFDLRLTEGWYDYNLKKLRSNSSGYFEPPIPALLSCPDDMENSIEIKRYNSQILSTGLYHMIIPNRKKGSRSFVVDSKKYGKNKFYVNKEVKVKLDYIKKVGNTQRKKFRTSFFEIPAYLYGISSKKKNTYRITKLNVPPFISSAVHVIAKPPSSFAADYILKLKREEYLVGDYHLHPGDFDVLSGTDLEGIIHMYNLFSHNIEYRLPRKKFRHMFKIVDPQMSDWKIYGVDLDVSREKVYHSKVKWKRVVPARK